MNKCFIQIHIQQIGLHYTIFFINTDKTTVNDPVCLKHQYQNKKGQVSRICNALFLLPSKDTSYVKNLQFICWTKLVIYIVFILKFSNFIFTFQLKSLNQWSKSCSIHNFWLGQKQKQRILLSARTRPPTSSDKEQICHHTVLRICVSILIKKLALQYFIVFDLQFG